MPRQNVSDSANNSEVKIRLSQPFYRTFVDAGWQGKKVVTLNKQQSQHGYYCIDVTAQDESGQNYLFALSPSWGGETDLTKYLKCQG